jgi:hypothetical protein
VTYSQVVSHASARQSLTRLARLLGWKISAPVVKDQEFFGVGAGGERKSLGKQTGVEANATGVSNLTFGAAFRLQPFVEAYRDLSRLDLFFMTGGLASFNGLRAFSHPALAVTLVQDGGPYRYHVDIRDHRSALPKLPLNEPPATALQPGAAVQGTTQSKPRSLWPIVMLAVCAGIAVFAALRLLTALHGGGRPGSLPKGGRPLQPGPYIVNRRKD